MNATALIALTTAAALAGCLDPQPPEIKEREVEVPTIPRVELPPSCGNLTLRVEPAVIRDAPAIVEARFGGCDGRELVIGQAACARTEDHIDVTVEVNATAWRVTNGSAGPLASVCSASEPSKDRLAPGEWISARVAWNGSILAGDSPERVPAGDYVVSAWLMVEGRIFLEQANVSVL